MDKKPLTADEAIEQLQRHVQRNVSREERQQLAIVVFNPGSIGGRPSVGVERIDAGFDWDNGKLLLTPLQPLTRLTPEDVAAIHVSARAGQSWHAYQAQKAMRERIRVLESELSTLKATP